MRILLTGVSDEIGETHEIDMLAQRLAEIGHQADIFIAPKGASLQDEFFYRELKKQLRRTIHLLNPDVIECFDADLVAYALGELGYGYIVNMGKESKTLVLTSEEDDTQVKIIRKASFIFTENESQKENLISVLKIDEKKLVSMPMNSKEPILVERLAYYQQMLVRHSLH